MLETLILKPEAFGLDISDLSLKIIRLKKKSCFWRPLSPAGECLSLASFGEIPIKPGVIEGGEIKNEKALTGSIKELLTKVKGERLKTGHVVVSLPEEKAFLQVIQMPKMKEGELKKAVYFEGENYVPLPIEKVYLDSQMVAPVYDHLDHLDVLIAALPKKIVDSYVSCLKKAELTPEVLEIESQSISRAMVKNGLSQVPLLLVDLGATRTSFIIFSGHSLRFTVSIPVSSGGFTRTISRALGVDLKRAEELKVGYGIQAKSKGEGKKVFEALVPAMTDLVAKTKKYLDYYQTHAGHEHLSRVSGRKVSFGDQPKGKKVQKIHLCGGGANLKGLCDFLSLELKLQVELGNPWTNILPEPLREVPELPYRESLKYTTALGLALRGLKGNKET